MRLELIILIVFLLVDGIIIYEFYYKTKRKKNKEITNK
jgi:hypothetical protein